MFGNLVNNKQLLKLKEQRVIEIEPFDENNLSLAHYSLHVQKIKKYSNEDVSFKTIIDFGEGNDTYQLEPNDYIVVQIQEIIRLHDDAIVGHFTPTSNLIEEGLGLVAGKIDKKYGTHNTGSDQEMIQFGIKNLTDRIIPIKPFHRVAHLSLYDLSGVASLKTELTEQDKLNIFKRMKRDYMDGPIPTEE